MDKDILTKGSALLGEIEQLQDRINLFSNLPEKEEIRLSANSNSITLQPDDPIYSGIVVLVVGQYSDKLKRLQQEFDEL